MKKLTVNLKTRSYPIFVGAALEALGRRLQQQQFSRRMLVVTNTTVKKLYAAPLVAGLQAAGFEVAVAAIPDGERYKTFDTVKTLYRAALRARLDRRSAIIALGGGVVGDLAGFVAATYLRGLPFVQVPTTLLAMVDSSVGGKTGFDLEEGKNLVGAFHQPKLVWIDTATLETLPARQVRNGLAEVIKYGVIHDARFFRYLEQTLRSNEKIKPADYEKIIYRCCRIKALVVEQDEFEEKGLREILNFGHTFGHAIETLTGYKTCNHGEAVALGMLMAGKLAVKLGLFSAPEQKRLEALTAGTGLPVAPARPLRADAMLSLMMRDKKVREGKLRFVLPLALGKTTVRSDVPVSLVKEVLT